MKYNKILFGLIGLLILVGCYKDKGNYTYKDIPQATIKIYRVLPDGSTSEKAQGENEKLYAYLAQPFRVKSEVIFDKEELAHNELEYTWSLDNVVLSKDKDLNVELSMDTKMFDYFGALTVYDKRTGLTYVHKMRVNLASAFTTGWVWLAKDNGKSDINMFNNQYNLYTNMYYKINASNIDDDTFDIIEHFLPRDKNFMYGQLLLVSSGKNGEQGSVDIDHTTFRTKYLLKNEFMGASLPIGEEIANVAYIDYWTAAVSKSGKLYMRYAKGGFFQQGLFNNVPVYGNYNLSNIMAPAIQNQSNTVIFYDKLSKAYMYLCHGTLKSFDLSKDLGTAFNITDVQNEPFYIKSVDIVDNMNRFLAMYRNSSNNLFIQEFDVAVDANKNVTYKTVDEYEFGYPAYINSNTIFDATWRHKNIIFSTGDKLYLYDKIAKTEPILIKDFKGKNITSLASGMSLNSWIKYKEDIGVTVDNGNGTYNFYVVSAAGSNIGTLTQTKENLVGEPYKMIFKLGMNTGLDY